MSYVTENKKYRTYGKYSSEINSEQICIYLISFIFDKHNQHEQIYICYN